MLAFSVAIMITINFCRKMSHATTRLDVFRHAVVRTPAIFFPRKPDLFIALEIPIYRFQKASGFYDSYELTVAVCMLLSLVEIACICTW